MAGSPGFQKVEGFRAAYLANRDSIWAQPQRGADQVRERGRAVLGAERHKVWRGTLQLPGVLDQNHAVAAPGDFGEERIDQRRLAGRSAAGDEDVLPIPDRCPQELGL